MAEGFQKQNGYAVLNIAGAVDSRGYALLASGAQIPVSTSYAMLSNAAINSSVATYGIFSNPASVMNGMAYTIFHNDSALTNSLGYVILAVRYPPYSDIEIKLPFVEERFPECVSFGSSGGPGFKTSVFEFDSGFTADKIEWERLRARYSVTFENATPTDIEEVENFFYGMRGKAIGFRYKDWNDYQISSQNVFVGDGSTRVFQVFKRYTSGGHIFDRKITKLVDLTMDLTVDGNTLLEGSDFFVNDTTGEIILPVAPPAGVIGTLNYVEFDTPVRFDTDRLDVAYDDFKQLNINNLEMVEVLI